MTIHCFTDGREDNRDGNRPVGVAAAEIIRSVKSRLPRGVVPFGNMFVYLLNKLIGVQKEATVDDAESGCGDVKNSTLWIAWLKRTQ